MFIRHQGSENSPATTQNSLAKICLFPERALAFHNHPPVICCILTLIKLLINENPAKYFKIDQLQLLNYCIKNKGTGQGRNEETRSFIKVFIDEWAKTEKREKNSIQ